MTKSQTRRGRGQFFTWNATVRSYVIASLQGHTDHQLEARKMWSTDQGDGIFRCEVIATPAQLAAIQTAVRDVCRAEGLAKAHSW